MNLEKTLKDLLIGKKFSGFQESYCDTAIFYFGKVSEVDWHDGGKRRFRTRSAEYEIRAWAADWETNKNGDVGNATSVRVTDVLVNLVQGEGYHLTINLSDGRNIYLKPDSARLPDEQDDIDDWYVTTPDEHIKVGPFSKIERIPRCQ